MMRFGSGRISRDHPLRTLFQELVHRHLFLGAQLYDAQIAQYVTGVLTDFTHIDNLYRIRSARGRRLEDVADLLIESNPLLDGSSFDREREVRKQIGDFTLFFTGIFPEAIASLPRLRPLSLDAFVDYMEAGKKSYGVVASFNVFEYETEAPLFRRLSDRFEQCVFGLNMVKGELEQRQRAALRRLRSDLGLGFTDP
jgi:hypothetical protein